MMLYGKMVMTVMILPPVMMDKGEEACIFIDLNILLHVIITIKFTKIVIHFFLFAIVGRVLVNASTTACED